MKDKKSITENCPMSTIYLDQIENVLELLRQSNVKDIKIDTNEYKIQDLDELSRIYKNNSKICLYIRSDNPDISIELTPYGVRVFGGDGSNKTVGLVNKISEVLSQNDKPFINFFHEYGPWFMPLPLLPTFLILFNLISSGPHIIILTIILCIPLIIFVYSLVTPGAQIVLSQKNDSPGFLKRNKDQLIIFALGILATLITQWLIKKF